MRLMKWISRLLFALAVMLPLSAVGQGLLPNAMQTFTDRNGAPLVGGKVYTYLPGTTTDVTTYSDSALTVPNTDPVVLNASGQAAIWATGKIREVVYDQFGNLIWDAVSLAPVGGGSSASFVNVTASGTMAVGGAMTVGGNGTVNGSLTVGGNIAGGGGLSLTAGISGATTGAFSGLVSSNGSGSSLFTGWTSGQSPVFQGATCLTCYPVAALDAVGSWPIFLGRRTDGTAVAPTAVQNGEFLGGLWFGGYNGSGEINNAAEVMGEATENWGGTNNGARLDFRITQNGAQGAVDAFWISHNGHLVTRTTAGVPTVSGAGTGAVVNGDDVNAHVVVGSSPTASFTVTFASPFENSPTCFANNETSVARPAYVLNNLPGSFVISTSAAAFVAGDVVDFFCMGYR